MATTYTKIVASQHPRRSSAVETLVASTEAARWVRYYRRQGYRVVNVFEPTVEEVTAHEASRPTAAALFARFGE